MDAPTLASIIGSAAFIAMLLQLVKFYVPTLPTRFLPLVTIAFTDGCGIVAAAVRGNLTGLVVGTIIVGGFTASGFYAGAKAVINPAPAAPTPVTTTNASASTGMP